MKANIRLDELASIAALSKFHLIREFKAASIATPIIVSGEVVMEVAIPFVTAQLINAIQAGATLGELMPYAYTIAREAVDGKPMIRAMLLDDPNPYTLGTATRYQFLYGPYLLVAPIYRATAADDEGNDLRDGIYLPEGNWIDFFSGDLYTGGRIINNFDAPLWKLPVFVRQGAILPMAAPHNNVAQADPRERIYEFYPLGRTEFTEYDDDGTTQGYLKGACARTPIVSELQGEGLKIRIGKTQGAFDGMQPEKRTVLRINATQRPAKIAVRIGGRKVRIAEASSAEAFARGVTSYFTARALTDSGSWGSGRLTGHIDLFGVMRAVMEKSRQENADFTFEKEELTVKIAVEKKNLRYIIEAETARLKKLTQKLQGAIVAVEALNR